MKVFLVFKIVLEIIYVNEGMRVYKDNLYFIRFYTNVLKVFKNIN